MASKESVFELYFEKDMFQKRHDHCVEFMEQDHSETNHLISNELKKSLHPYLSASVLNELLIQYLYNVLSQMWPQHNAEALKTIMSTNESNFELYLEKGCRVVTSEACGIEPFLLYATDKYQIQRSMRGARAEMFQKRFDCVEFMEEDLETNNLISTILQQVLCILNVLILLLTKYSLVSR